MKAGQINLILLLIFLANIVIEATKLNYPRVLLPIFNTVSIKFTLEVIEKGCFKWSTSRQDLILITPLYEDADGECAYRATVTVLTRERRRNTAIVLAENLSNEESLRCDVILDVIDRLGVHTTTRQLFLEEAPETFELRAEDSEGNAFTTLEGIEFNWVISSVNKQTKGWSPALRFLTFTESSYHEVPPALEKFEAQHKKGYMLLLEGINTGTAKVTVSLPYPEYAHVPSIEVYINVLANIILEPSDVHILPGDTINFRILQLKQGKLHEITLNQQYYLESEHPAIANIHGNSATGIQLGRTAVVLRDRNVPTEGTFGADNSVIKSAVPIAQLTVSSPARLGLSLLPHNIWLTVEGERHEIALDLYTKDEHKITLGPRYSMSAELDEMLFYILKRNSNNSRLYGAAVKPGTTPVYGSFRDLTAQAELQIFGQLFLTPRQVILPYDPNVVISQKIQFVASGGDGAYAWHSQNTRMLNVNQNGLATTVVAVRDSDKRAAAAAAAAAASLEIIDAASFMLHTSVRVALSKNQYIQRQAEVYFVAPVKLEIIKYNFETALRDYVRLHIALYGYINETYVPFTKCDNIIFDLEFSNLIFQVESGESSSGGGVVGGSAAQTDEKLANGACQMLHLRSTAVGLTQLNLSYKFQNKRLKEELTLSVFERMGILNPAENKVILPIGSSRNIIYTFGPQRIFTLEAELTKTMLYEQNIAEVVEMKLESQQNIYAFTVMCRKVGETVLNFNIYNALNTPKFEAYASNILTKVDCVKPRFLNLYAVEPLRQSCPLEMRNSLLHVKEQQNDKFEIEIEVQDAQHRKLMNISSLFIDWEFAAGNERLSSDAIRHYRHSEVELLQDIRLPVKDVLITKISEQVKNFKIKGIVTRYDSSILRKHGINAESPNFGIVNPKTGETFTPIIENEIRYMAVEGKLFTTDHISIFMAKNRRERIPIAQGSGHYEFQVSESGFIDVVLDAKERELVITPLRIGHVRIELIDRCLMTEPAILSVSVVTIAAIDARSPDRVERAKSIEAIITLYDTNERPLHIDPFNLQIYQLSENIFNLNILSITLGDQMDLNEGEIRYLITGNNLGETKVDFTAGSGDTAISSEPINVQVFAPLRLYPRTTTLVVGSNIQIHYQGGPLPDGNVVYSVQDKKVISMKSAIVAGLKLGTSKIFGKCMMKNPATGKDIVISEDAIEVRVVPLLNIQIRAPLIRICSGAVMPAAVWGLPELSPMVLGTLENMRLVWSTDQTDVVDIYNIFADAGIEYGEQDLISMRVKALKPGKARITATMIFPNNEQLSTSIEVVVFRKLELEIPKHMAKDWILIAPRSIVQLKANLDDAIYKPDTDSSGIVHVSPDGILRTKDTLGRDLLIVKTFEQSLPIGVEVKNVHYILARLEYPTLKLKHTEEKIPRGMSFILKVSLHDNLGNEFTHNIEDVNGIKYELSQKDVVDVQIGNNMTVALNLPRATSNMIALTLRDNTGLKYAEDYIKLSVADSKNFYPNKLVFSVGDIICFDSPLTLSSIWTSSNEKLLAIDPQSGVARVLGNNLKTGESVVVTNGDKGSSGSFLKYDVEVRDADVLELLKSFDIFSGTTYRAYLVMRHHLQVNKSSNVIAQNISKCFHRLESLSSKFLNCQLSSKQPLGKQLLQHYKTVPIFESESGRYACQIDLASSFAQVLALVQTNDVLLELEARLFNGASDTMKLKFLPGIKVLPESLYMNNMDQELTVTGLDKVLQKLEVKPSDPSFLDVAVRTKAHGSLQYRVRMQKEMPVNEQLFVHLYSPETLQNIEIPVLGSNALQQKCSSQPFSNSSTFLSRLLSNVGLVLTTLIMLVGALLAFLYVFPQEGKGDIINSDVFSSTMRGKTLDRSLQSSTPRKSQASPLYPNLTTYYDENRSPTRLTSRISDVDESQVYGNTAPLISPERRVHHRFL